MDGQVEDTPSVQVKNDKFKNKLEPWSDKRCIKISFQNSFPSMVKDVNVQKKIINRFLNFYLVGKVPKGLSATDLIFAVISIIPHSLDSDESIWHDDNYSEDGSLFFLMPEDKIKAEINNIMKNRKNNEHCSSESDIKIITEDTEDSIHDIPDDDINDNQNEDKVKYNADTVKDNTDESSSSINNENNSSSQSIPKSDTEESLKSESKDKDDIFKNIQWYSSKTSVRLVEYLNDYGPAENAAFCISCNKLLNVWDTDVEGRNVLKYFFGVVALILMRAIAKKNQNIIKTFLRKSHLDRLTGGFIQYSVPDKSCVIKSCKAIRGKNRNTQIMYAKLVLLKFRSPSKFDSIETPPAFGIRNVIDFGVLSHISNYGMGIVSLLQVLAKHSEGSFDIAFKAMYSEDTAVSWERVKDHFDRFMLKSAKQHLYHWARVIEWEQFEYLTCEANYELAVVAGIFIENLQKDSGIWRSTWVSRRKDIDKYKELGNVLYEKYKVDLKRKISNDFDSLLEIVRQSFGNI